MMRGVESARRVRPSRELQGKQGKRDRDKRRQPESRISCHENHNGRDREAQSDTDETEAAGARDRCHDRASDLHDAQRVKPHRFEPGCGEEFDFGRGLNQFRSARDKAQQAQRHEQYVE